MRKLLLAGVFLAVAVPASAEGLVWIPGQGWRAAPCCREYGYPGVRGIPPLEFIIGALAPAMAPYLPPPFGYAEPPPPPQPRYYAPPQPAYGPPNYQQGYRRPPGPPAGRYAGPPVQEEAEPYEEAPQQAPQAPPPGLAPGQPSSGFIEFCNSNPAAPPCRNRVRGQR